MHSMMTYGSSKLKAVSSLNDSTKAPIGRCAVTQHFVWTWYWLDRMCC